MKLILLSLVVVIINYGFAQEEEKAKPNFNQWSIDGKIGVNNPIKNFTPGYNTPLYNIGTAGLGVRYMFNAYFGLRIGATFNRFQDNKESFDFSTNHGRFELEGIVDIGNTLHFYQWTDRLSLLGHAGAGFGRIKPEGFPLNFLPLEKAGSDRTGILSLGLTPQIKLSPKMALNLDAGVIFQGRTHHTFDYNTQSGDKDGYFSTFFEGTIGLSYYLGKKESHADWTPTKSVSKSELDALAAETALLRKGMEDDDKDGVPNYLDQELDSPENSVVDVKGVARPDLNDSDKDGIPDAYDLCPTEKGLFSTNGCPDRDKDGIADKDDKCPDEPGIASEQGCAPKYKSIGSAGDAHSMVYFETNSSNLSSAEKRKLDAVASLMKTNKAQKVVLNGHADSRGGDNLNNNLSADRAAASKKYLISKGVASSRIETNSFGSSQPAVSNGTSEGLAQNRRVEIQLK